jgi:hypothetical protein
MRALTVAQTAATAAEQVQMAWLVYLDFAAAPVRFTTAGWDVIWSGDTYTAAGNLLSISRIAEGAQLESRGIQVSLSGVSTALISAAQLERYRGRRARCWLATFDAAGAVVADPVPAWSGRMDALGVSGLGAGADCAITVAIEDRLADFLRARVRYWNGPDQRSQWPADAGFDYSAAQADKPLVWGMGAWKQTWR